MNLEPVMTLLRPLHLLALSASFLPHTIYDLVTSLNFKPLTSLSSFKDHWFARFWSWFAPLMAANMSPQVVSLFTDVTGTVLDIGPGQGHFLHLYAKAPGRSKITKIYAVEPNRGHHATLNANARKAGLEDVFEILDSPIETLESKAGIQRQSIDTIVTLQVLCSINDPEILIKELRSYLKPNGGRWVVCEHVRRLDNGGVALWQNTLNYVWPTFFNGCNLTRETALFIERSGGWDMERSNGGLKPAKGDSPWAPLPTMMGVLVSQ